MVKRSSDIMHMYIIYPYLEESQWPSLSSEDDAVKYGPELSRFGVHHPSL